MHRWESKTKQSSSVQCNYLCGSIDFSMEMSDFATVNAFNEHYFLNVLQSFIRFTTFSY